MPRRKPFRENVKRVLPLTRSSWSSWYTALVPSANAPPQNYEPRNEGNEGVIFRVIEKRFRKGGFDNGIYELRVSRGKRHLVVYIGKSHSRSPHSINNRIREYCRDGSHIRYEINRAMKLGYTLSVRAKNIPGSEDDVRECEEKYLEEYDYAWNDIKNDDVRENVPPR